MRTERETLRVVKKRLRDLLRRPSPAECLAEVKRHPARRIINPLISFLCHSDESVRWNAIRCIGSVVADLADADPESARVVMRRLMWSLNDESGGIGWGAPEAMGEIMARHAGLAGEYAPILISYLDPRANYLESEVLQRGTVWALGRLGRRFPELVMHAESHLTGLLDSTDATLRGLAVLTLGILGSGRPRERIQALISDPAEILLRENHTSSRRTVGALAQEALERMERRP